MFVEREGKLVDLQEELDQKTFDLTPPPASKPGAIAPRLIAFNQWASCYTSNNANDVFREYVHYWNGVGHDVRLKCGTTGTSGWGYRHIEEGHKAHWQSELDKARNKGWVSEKQGVHSWDDLMAGAVGSAISWPEIIGGSTLNQTKCGITRLVLVRSDTGAIVHTIPVLASWATNSDRLITTYPSTKQNC